MRRHACRFPTQDRHRRFGSRLRLTVAILAGATVSLTAGVAAASAAAAAPAHVVVPGESLWTIAADALPAGASDAQIATAVARIVGRNADRLPRGASHLVSGQSLRLPGSLAREQRRRAAHRIRAAEWSASVRAGDGAGSPSGSAQVAEVQRRLACAGFGVEADGVFGPDTQAAVTTFQRLHGLRAGGVVERRTLRTLRSACPTPARAERGAEKRTKSAPATTTEPAPAIVEDEVPNAPVIEDAPAATPVATPQPTRLASARRDAASESRPVLIAALVGVLGVIAMLLVLRGTAGRAAMAEFGDGTAIVPARRRPGAWVERAPRMPVIHMRMDRRVAVLTTVAIVGGIVTLVVASLDLLHRSPGAHIAIETCTTLIAVSCALLLLGRLRGWGSSEELLLMAAVAVVGLGELLYSLLPSMIGEGLGPFATWSSIVVRLAGAVLFAVAAVLADRRLASPARTARQTLALCAAGVLATGLLVLAIDPGPTAIRRGEEPFAHALIGAAQVASIALFALAAVAFGVRSLRRRDELVFCVALANVLAALAAANFLVFPSLYTSWVSVGDGFRLASALALLTGVWMEVTAYQRQLAHEAVLEERRRMARDLHDGIAQDLAFIRSQTAELAVAVPDDRRAARITGAAQRALDESRSAIAVLTRPEDEPLDATVRAVAEEIADWSDAEVVVAIDPALEVDADVRAELIRIIREAVANAVRHGDASAVRIEARRRGGVYVRVADDGHGFDVCGAVRPGAFGLTSMRERAERLDARFRLQSAPGAGTVVEVTLP